MLGPQEITKKVDQRAVLHSISGNCPLSSLNIAFFKRTMAPTHIAHPPSGYFSHKTPYVFIFISLRAEKGNTLPPQMVSITSVIKPSPSQA